MEEFVSDDLKTVYNLPAPLISTFLPAEGLGQAGGWAVTTALKGLGLCARLPGFEIQLLHLQADRLGQVSEPSKPQFPDLSSGDKEGVASQGCPEDSI